MKDFYSKRIDVNVQLLSIIVLIFVALTAFVYNITELGIETLTIYKQCVLLISVTVNIGLAYFFIKFVSRIFEDLNHLKDDSLT